MTITRTSITVLCALLASACGDGAERAAGPSDAPAGAPTIAVEKPGPKFAAIGAHETISFLGTEPFWGGSVAGGQLTYSTPENQDGETVAARRFAGNNGLGFSGQLNDRAFDLAITPGECSDGMSDRTYPYVATLKLGEEQRNGCAWTARQPYRGTGKP